jgi:hypothetical protein
MSIETSNPQRLAQLNREIEQLEARTPQLEAERAALARGVRRTAWRWRYLRIARALRSPTATFDMWPYGVLLVGPFMVGVLMFVLANFATGSFAPSFLTFLLGAAASACVIAALLYRPTNELLPAALASAESERRLAQARLDESLQTQTRTKGQLAELLEERRELMASGKVQRAALLQREWKTMAAAEWEDFLVEVLRTLGATVERSPRSLDEGVTLIAHFPNRRVAILPQGEGHVVDSTTVHQAVAKMKRHGCDTSAVILNRRFTGAAQDFASRNNCSLIGVEEFPDFVMGQCFDFNKG